MFGPDVIQEATEKIKLIKERMKAAQSRQKAYADNRRRPLEFEVGDSVFLKVSPMKGVRRTGSKNKLAPRYVGPFEILDKIGPVAYRLALPPALERMHNVFHISQLRKYVPDPGHVISYEPLHILEDMSYAEEPVLVLDRKEKQLRSKKYFLGQGFMEKSKHRGSHLGAGRGDKKSLSTFVPRYVKFRGRNFHKEGRM